MASYTAESREAQRAPLPIDSRKDNWWAAPLYTAFVLTAFGIYVTFRAFQNQFFCWPAPAAGASFEHIRTTVEQATYLSPMYSPFIPLRLTIGTFVISPAVYILIFPLAFRMTCYYYRKAYYRAFFWDPPACAVAEPNPDGRMRYTGERNFPFILQNLHRYAFFAAAIFVIILAYDAVKSFFYFTDGGWHFRVGFGSLLMVVNVLALGAYTFGCHSWRHLVGGKQNCYSCSCLAQSQYGVWKKVSFLNSRHALYAWISLYTVALTDVYVYLIAAGVIGNDTFIKF